jgi:hypothetical protein
MELLFVVVISAGIGGILRYALPNRLTYGLLLLPALSASVTAAAWVSLLWAGLTFNGGWIWVASLVIGGGAALAAALILPKRRADHDAKMLERLARA